MNDIKDLFISYGRGESLAFAARLHQRIRQAGLDAWFDKINIPHGDDYQQRINHGIERAHNFIFIMAPHAIRSKYCLIEVGHAWQCGKRIIPLLHIMPDNEDWSYAAQQERQAGNDRLAEELQSYISYLQSIDWIYAREQRGDIAALMRWRDQYENTWKQHEDNTYLEQWTGPITWQAVDDFTAAVDKVKALINYQAAYVHQHTEILLQALLWQSHQKATRYLLVGKERQAAQEWLLTEFLPPKQPPCRPTDLQCEFICEARKNAENLMTNGFMCHEAQDRGVREQIVRSLSRYAVTTWSHDRDIHKGSAYERAIEEGIEKADICFYFISPHSVTSAYCHRELAHALQYQQRIIPLLITPTPESDIPVTIRTLQRIDFTDNVNQADYDQDIDDILNLLNHDKTYYEQRKVLLVRALQWERSNHQPSFLLRGFNLDLAQTWLRLNEQRESHPPTELHRQFIIASEAAKGQLNTDVFISYSRKDSDLARRLNTALQQAGKTTWFDQESISSGVDFETEIFKGITGADNLVFILSPDAVTSEYCEREVQFADQEGKRFIPLLYRQVNPAILPAALRKQQWIDFQTVDFDIAFLELIQAIEIDREHARQHTVLQQRATEWEENGRSQDFLLNSTACDKAEQWLAFATKKQPIPTKLQQTFIAESRTTITATARKTAQRQLELEQHRERIQQEERRARQRIFQLWGMFIIFIVSGLWYSISDYLNAKNNLENADEMMQQQTENNIFNAIKLVGAGHKVLERFINKDMKDAFVTFIDAYEVSAHNPKKMELDDLKKQLGGKMDLYLINADGIVEYTTYTKDLGLDFKKWPDVFTFITKVRQQNHFVSGGFATEARTGSIRKFAYMPTPDHKYLLELSLFSDEFSDLMGGLDVVQIADQLKTFNPSLNQVRIFSRHGPLGDPDYEVEVNEETTQIIKTVYDTKKTVEIEDKTRKHYTRYIFINLKDEDVDVSSDPSKVIELNYNTKLIDEALQKNVSFHVLMFVISTTLAGILLFLTILFKKR